MADFNQLADFSAATVGKRNAKLFSFNVESPLGNKADNTLNNITSAFTQGTQNLANAATNVIPRSVNIKTNVESKTVNNIVLLAILIVVTKLLKWW